ncbi:MAG: Dna2/Cas4 domain-containing protein [Candidatus Omnitrophota bacterium]
MSYLLRLKESGVEAAGEILVPKEKHKEIVSLTPESEAELKHDIAGLEKVIMEDLPPRLKKTGFCRNCAYNEFCWAEAEE